MKQTVSFNGTDCLLRVNGITLYERLVPPFKQKKIYGI